MTRRSSYALVCVAAIMSMFPWSSAVAMEDSVDMNVNLLISTMNVVSIGRAAYNRPATCLDSSCYMWGTHRIDGGSASASFDQSNGVYERQLDEYWRQGDCYRGYIEARTSGYFYGSRQTPTRCAPCILTVELSGAGTVSGAPIGSSLYECGTGVNLQASPANGWVFAGWTGSVTSNSPFLGITVQPYLQVTASFEVEPISDPPGGGDDQDYGADSPLVLDLNGDGINTTGIDDPVLFDLNGDGVAESLTWTDSTTEEGFLWIDINLNGVVDDGHELFGVGTVLPDGMRAPDGFAALSMYDDPRYGGNANGIIDSRDRVWGRLRVWVDRNHDGMSSPGEIGPIHAFGVFALNLSYVVDSSPDANGNVHLYQSTWLRRREGELERFLLHDVFFQRVSQ